MAGFSERLTVSDVTSRLAVPTGWWNRLAVPTGWWNLIEPLFGRRRRVVQLRLVDDGGMFWEFECAVRQKGRHMKPVLQSGGWLKFVNNKGLKAGDRIVLDATEHEFRGTRLVLGAQRLANNGQSWFDV